jgi:hypothetical protein
MLFRRRKSVKHEEENLLLPLPGASRGRRRHMMSFKTAPFLLYFLKKTKKYETTSLFPKRVVSFKWELAPKRVRFKTRPWICARFAFWSLVSNFSIKSLIGHQTSIFMQLSPWFDQSNSQKL